MNHPICIKAPGKIILSGEHAVVYGCPALASTVDRYAMVESSFSSTGLTLHLENFAISVAFQWSEAIDLHQHIKEYYQRYCVGDLAISAVTSSPEDLLVFAIIEMYGNNIPSEGIEIRVKSDIPVGAGMGSSAAITAALLTSVSMLCGKTLAKDELYELTRRVENIQHGRSSGLDPAVIIQGGLILWNSGEMVQQQPVGSGSWYLLNTGAPTSTTGECVDHVRVSHGESDIWSSFTAVTVQLSAAIKQQNTGAIAAAIRANHQLLIQIGVVPDPIQQYISALESSGFSAKITGAGSVAGDVAGMLLIYSPSGQRPPELNAMEPQLLNFQQHQIHKCENL